MRRVIGCGLAAALATAAFVVPAGAQTVTKFSIVAIEVGGHRVDRDTFEFRDRLVEPNNHSHVLGRDEGRCTQISRTTVHCRVVFFFAAGKIKVNGRIDASRARNKVPVVGGTRAYNGVSGKAIVFFGGRNTPIDFTLVK